MRAFSRKTSQANRGMFLEEVIRQSNDRYKHSGVGIVEKVPTEWIPLRGPSGKIENAKVETRNAGVPDFMGAFKDTGPVAFDAKETTKGGRFPLEKIELEQITWLYQATNQGWNTFTIHFFAEHDAAYLLPFREILLPAYQLWRDLGGRKAPASIDELTFRTRGIRILPGRALALDYKTALDEYRNWQRYNDAINTAPPGR